MRLHFGAMVLMTIALLLPVTPILAREGDTLEPVTIDAPMLETYPENLFSDNDFKAIEGRVNEARNSGVPLSVRIVDLTVPDQPIPGAVKQLRSTDFSTPLTDVRANQITHAWMEQEPIETAPEAEDGILLLVLVPEDRTQTQAFWGIGPNALPLNGLTVGNIANTVAAMNAEFSQGHVANGVFRGLQEFGYNIQFGEPQRLERSTLQDALHTAMIPFAAATVLAGVGIPILAWRLSRRAAKVPAAHPGLTPWEAAAIQLGRVSPAVTTAMLLDAVHEGTIVSRSDGSLVLENDGGNPTVAAIWAFADSEGVIPRNAVLEIEGITQSVRDEMEDRLAAIGAFTDNVYTDRTLMFIAMGIGVFLIALSAVPVVVSMSAVGVFGITVALLGIAAGWWWLARRSYTTEAGETMVRTWLESASPEERNQYDLAVHQTYLIERSGGPNTSAQMRLVRQLRGLGAH